MDEEYFSLPEDEESPKVKKRRLHGACDTCRRRKVKCDSAAKPGNACTNCEISNTSCTHDIPRRPRKKDSQQNYIQTLEERLTKLEHFLHVLHPDKDIDNLLDLPSSETSDSITLNSDPIHQHSSKSFPELKYPGPPHLSPASASDEGLPVDPVEEAEDLAHVELEKHFNHLFVDEKRFFGQASTFMFATAAISAKNKATGSTQQCIDTSQLRRPLYWDPRPWEMDFAYSQEMKYAYPEPDLLDSLVSLYFEKSHIYLPVLHQPTFVRSLQSGLHLRDPSFGMTVLLVCAVASRYSSDIRVLLDEDTVGLSSGWKYFSQVPVFRNSLIHRSTTYDLQYYTLAIIYLLGTSVPHVSWVVLGLGIRIALEKGLHRRKGKLRNPTPEEELEKRAFWSLIVTDRWMSSFLGRPCALQDEDFDIEYPIECDDEYWETDDPEQSFKQPPGKPCKISAFIAQIRLVEIIGFTLRTLYSTKKSKILTGLIGNEWEQRVVAELDSSMNKWRDSLPQFLHWNPENPDQTFFRQSLAIHTAYFYLQILIHRPFLTKQSSLSLPSLAICSNAARSSVHAFEVGLTRGLIPFPMLFMSAFASSLVLQLNHWVNQRTNPKADSKSELELVRKCFLVFKEAERKWHSAGRCADVVQVLGHLNETRANPQPKRRRDSTTTEYIEPFPQDNSAHKASLLVSTPQFPPPKHTGPDSRVVEGPDLSTMPVNDWDISSLLMAQIGYMQQQQQLHQDPAAGQVNITHVNFPVTDSSSSVSDLTGTDVQGSYVSSHPPSQLYGSVLPTADPKYLNVNAIDDVLNMWSNLPVTYSSALDWETFIKDSMVQAYE